MSEYNHRLIGTIGVDDESGSLPRFGNKLPISVGVDTLGMCVISFASNYSLRIPEEDVDALRELLNTASVQLMVQRTAAKIVPAPEETKVAGYKY